MKPGKVANLIPLFHYAKFWEKREAKIGNESFAGKTPNFHETVEEQ